MNYTPVAVGIVSVLVMSTWLLSARKWFTGPVRQIESTVVGVDQVKPGAPVEVDAATSIPYADVEGGKGGVSVDGAE